MQINRPTKDDYPRLIEIWENAVRATHDFLSQDDITRLRALILDQYFDAVDLYVWRDEGLNIVGFIGLQGQKIEMLFVDPRAMKQGVGRALIDFAISNHGAKLVDVNAQNPGALAFYQKVGFKVVGRSETDGEGRPFPILHLQLSAQNHDAPT